jgi:hypothetical protein
VFGRYLKTKMIGAKTAMPPKMLPIALQLASTIPNSLKLYLLKVEEVNTLSVTRIIWTWKKAFSYW